MKEIKIDNLCAFCKYHPAECKASDIGFDEGSIGKDAVISCAEFQMVSSEEMYFLARCRNTIRTMMKDDKMSLKFDNINGEQSEASKMFCDILKDLYKNWEK